VGNSGKHAMKEYQGFAISNFRTGFDEAVEPWLLPRDAYQTMVNAHLYRGVLEKIEGYSLFANFTYRYIISLGTPDGMKKTWTGTIPAYLLPVTSNFFAYGTIVVGSTAETFTYTSDASSTVINLAGSAEGTGTVNISTGVYSINFNTAPPSDTNSCVFLAFDYAPIDSMHNPVAYAIMGIKQYFGTNGSQQVLVFDEKRLGIIVSNFGILAEQAKALQAVSEVPHDYYQSAIITGNGMTSTYTGTLAGTPFVPGTLVWTEYTSTGAPTGTIVKDNGSGGLTGSGVTSGAVNYVTGTYTITFSGNISNGNYFDSTTGVYGNLFTGGISNFFSLTNYQFKAFFCNNVDPIFYYDGTSIHYLNTSFSVQPISSASGVPTIGSGGYDISRCLHVVVNQNRLLLVSPTVDGILQSSAIYWSVIFNPLDFTNQEFLPAPTSEPIRTLSFINTDLVVRFSNSERIFRYTQDPSSPFRWDSTNNIWACDASYSAINYDSWFSSVGRPAIVGSDGVNVRRVDEIIPDFTDPTRLAQQTPVPFLNQTSIQQCYGERFDDIKEGWLCYNSLPESQSQVTASDFVLAFNYLDSTYATYSFPFSCLGFGRVINVPTWGTIFTNWEDMSVTWDSYQLQSNALVDLAGDQYDKVYELNSGNTQTIAGDPTTTPTPVLMSVITKNFNPFIEQGQLCRFGYIDLFVSAYQQSTLRVQFYLNDELYIDSNNEPAGYYQESILQFNPTDAMSPTNNQVKVWKRIYVGAVGKEHTIRFYQNIADFAVTDYQPIYIHAMVLYMKPAGRIFN
jgi:hypothetical protein